MAALERVRNLAIPAQRVHARLVVKLTRERETLIAELAKPGAVTPVRRLPSFLGIIFPPLGVGEMLGDRFLPGSWNQPVADAIAAIRMTEAQLITLRRTFTTESLEVLGLSVPAKAIPTEPAHALFLAVRGDMADTERRVDRMLDQINLGARILPAVRKTVFDPLSGGSFGGDVVGSFVALVIAGTLAVALVIGLSRR